MAISLSSVLLFSLVIPFIMTFSIGPNDTPYWLFGIIFLGLVSSIVLDILKIKERLKLTIKTYIVWFLIVVVIGSAFISAIMIRHKVAPVYNVHDIILQQEAAIRFLLDGKNPYSTTYFGTQLESWYYSDTEVNPALYHFVMQPFYLIFSLPFYFISNHTIGYFDGRIPLLFLFFASLFIIHLVVKEKENKLIFLTLFAFNPAMLSYTLEGRSDIFMYAFLMLSFYTLQKKQFILAGITLALAFAVKQSAWPLLPLYVSYLYLVRKSIYDVLKCILPLIITFTIIVGPFIFWDPKSYIDSTILYLSGAVLNSYPISGYGFGMVLHEFNIIKDLHDYFPFTLFQLSICIPLFFFLLKSLKKNTSVKSLILCYGILLFVFWYFSRYFNNSHLGFLSQVFITAYFWPNDKSQITS